jgi:hypothetical protein
MSKKLLDKKITKLKVTVDGKVEFDYSEDEEE